MNKRVVVFLLSFMISFIAFAQAPGGQITRKRTNTTTTTRPHSSDNKSQNEQSRLAQQRRAAQLQAERERKERMEQERAERERIAKAQAERERQEQEAREQAAKEAERTRILQNLINNMVYVEGGTFTMGATSEQGRRDAFSDEKPTHKVTLSSFSIGRYEVTQEEWQAVMGSNPSCFKGARRPVESVSWNDCQEFIRKLNAMTGRQFRLPTEAEWEYAARGGNKSLGYKYSGSNDINSVAWYDGNIRGGTYYEVGSKQPNELGLYDMSGNVCEWCQDWYDGNYYRSSPQTNPLGPSSGSRRVIRGGSWRYDASVSRVSSRRESSPDERDGIGGPGVNGFRLAL